MTYYPFHNATFFTNFLLKRGLLDFSSDKSAVWNQLTVPKWSNLHAGYLLKDSDRFISLLHDCQHKGVIIIPDYDTDGVCSGTILYQSLKLFGFEQVYLYTPKMSDGYGLSVSSVNQCLENAPFKAEVIVTTDNGIKAYEGIEYAKSLGLTVLVSDHHIGDSDEEPVADIIVNPNRQLYEDNYPFASISGSMVIWKLMQYYAVLYTNEFCQLAVNDLFVFAGLSTISDVMPLDDENRTIVQFTCQYLSDQQWLFDHVFNKVYPTHFRLCFLGFLSLLDVFFTKKKMSDQITYTDLGFYLSPILNTPRRIEDSSERAFRLFNIDAFMTDVQSSAIMPIDSEFTLFLLEDDLQAKYNMLCEENEYMFLAVSACLCHAKQLFLLNENRKRILDHCCQKVMGEFQSYDMDELIYHTVVKAPVTHGLVGLIAGKLMNKYALPFIVFGDRNQSVMSASARSPEGISIYEILKVIDEANPDLIINWGGHAQAAGLSIASVNFEVFAQLFSEVLLKILNARFGSVTAYFEFLQAYVSPLRDYFVWNEHKPHFWAQNERLVQTHDWYDCTQLQSTDGLMCVQSLDALAPFGQGFPGPDNIVVVSLSKQQYLEQFRLIGKDRSHGKLQLVNKVGTTLDCLFWNVGIQLQHTLDKHFLTNEIALCFIGGTFSINEFRGKQSLQLTNATLSILS